MLLVHQGLGITLNPKKPKLKLPGCTCAGAAERALDMQAPAPAEAASLQAPLAALRARLAALLADWPGHPVLSQLDAITKRLLGALIRVQPFCEHFPSLCLAALACSTDACMATDAGMATKNLNLTRPGVAL